MDQELPAGDIYWGLNREAETADNARPVNTPTSVKENAMTPETFKQRIMMEPADMLDRAMKRVVGDDYATRIMAELAAEHNDKERFSKTSKKYVESFMRRMEEAQKATVKTRKFERTKAGKIWQHMPMLITLAEKTTVPDTLEFIRRQYKIKLTPQYFRRLRKSFEEQLNISFPVQEPAKAEKRKVVEL